MTPLKSNSRSVCVCVCVCACVRASHVPFLSVCVCSGCTACVFNSEHQLFTAGTEDVRTVL